jgi:hypothetical protein|tara:strand:+ start:159 stop:374 length:216 start_codon:yes stop_codon:yes gene_type:complete
MVVEAVAVLEEILVTVLLEEILGLEEEELVQPVLVMVVLAQQTEAVVEEVLVDGVMTLKQVVLGLLLSVIK